VFKQDRKGRNREVCGYAHESRVDMERVNGKKEKRRENKGRIGA